MRIIPALARYEKTSTFFLNATNVDAVLRFLRRATVVGTQPGVLDVHCSRLSVLGAKFGLISAAVCAIRRPFGTALVGTPLAVDVHPPIPGVLGAELGLSPAIVYDIVRLLDAAFVDTVYAP